MTAWLSRRFSALLAALLGLMIYGGVALTQLPQGLYPEVSFPRIVVVAFTPDLAVETMALTVTRRLEDELATVLGVVRIRSRTIRSAAEISLVFADHTDMVQALAQVNAKLSASQADLPPGTDLEAERITPGSFPVISIDVEGADPVVLRELALYQIRPRLSRLPGVGRVDVQGGDTREIEVIVDPSRLQAAGLTLSQVADKVAGGTRIQTVGRALDKYQQPIVLLQGPGQTIDDVGRVTAGGTPEQPVFVRDLARVVDGHSDRKSMVSGWDGAAVTLSVARRIGTDAVQVAALVREELQRIGPSLPKGVTLRVGYDQSELIVDAVHNVRDAVILGAILAAAVLLLFLRALRETLLAALTLPVTVLLTFGLMRLWGESLNLMSLGGLAVAIGLVIDDAVVVVEAIHRHLAAGQGAGPASERAVSELWAPVVSSTLTTVVVFLPLGLLTGVAGQFFGSLSLTLSAAVLLSLIVALLVLPPAAARVLRPRTEASADSVQRAYHRVLDRALAHPRLTLLVAPALLVLGAVAVARLETGFLPEMDEGAFVLDYYTPVGTSLPEADLLATRIEDVLRKVPEVTSFQRRLGVELGPPAATDPSRGDVAVRLRTDRDRDIETIMDEVRGLVSARVPGVRLEFTQVLQDMLGDMEGSPEPLEIKLFGSQRSALEHAGRAVAQAVGKVKGLVDLFDGVAACSPELHFVVDPEAAGRLGLTTADVADQVSAAMDGKLSGAVRREDRLVNVRVRLPDEVRLSPDSMQHFAIRSSDGQTQELGSLATLQPGCVPSEILRENQRQMIAVTGRLAGRDLGSVTSEAERRLAAVNLPSGVDSELGGQRQSQVESFRDLAAVMALALALVLVVLAFHLRSLRLALLVLTAVPLALAAGMVGLWATGVPLNVSSFMGSILLVGLVVKNGILLLDRAEGARGEGLDPTAAITAAASERVRPILMTTLCTLLGLAPLAVGLGAGADLQRPLAIAVIAGLSISTLITLVMVPAGYRLMMGRAAGS